MKKLLFISFAVIGLSQVSSAQSAKSTGATASDQPANKAQAAIDSRAKLKAEGKMDPAKESTATNTNKSQKTSDATIARYKKAGLNDSQISSVSESMQKLDKEKTEIMNNPQLTPEQKKNGLAAIETERNASLMKTMGKESYKKYTGLNQPTGKQAQTKPTLKPAN